MAQSRIGRYTACKPMLVGTLELIAGYKAFHDQEGKYTQIALREMPDAVATWYRYLTLYELGPACAAHAALARIRHADSAPVAPTALWSTSRP